MNKIKLIILLTLLATSAYAFNGMLFKQEIEGEYRICYYQDGPEIRVKSYHVSQPCPVDLQED